MRTVSLVWYEANAQRASCLFGKSLIQMALRNLLQSYTHLNELAFQLLFLFFLKTRCMPLLIHTALVLLVNHLGTCIFLSLTQYPELML